MRRLASIAAALALAACVSTPPQTPAEYDFGPGAATREEPPRLRREITVAAVTAPAWLESPALVYRLAYLDASQPRAYVESRWVARPAELFTARLRQRLAATTASGVLVPADGVRTAVTLRVEVQEFSQVFDAPDRSRALVRVRGVLVADGRLVAQTTFSAERVAPSADAGGGARALGLAADVAIDRLIGWTADALK
ncbi:MAG: membrane integrity-associated transporter subunit PqiC [Burkholderiales bacterium]|nr:membrane integrity-associated transporter subunit PqiC [Burkholderiales bacterium]